MVHVVDLWMQQDFFVNVAMGVIGTPYNRSSNRGQKHWFCWQLWCCSLRAHYICIVAVQHCHSSKIDLLILSKLVAVKKSVFTSSHVLLQYNSSIFWGAMKRYLREPAEKHSESKCHGFCWCAFQLEIGASDDTMDGAYRDGKGTIQVKKFGSCKQSSRHWVYEPVAHVFD